jgi:maltose O-acetyltransferase
MGCFFTGNKIIIGNNTVLNRKCYIDGRYGIEIGSNVNISPECYLVSLTHDFNSNEFKTFGKIIVIGDYCWIGVRTLILPGVQLKKGCIVGAGSVVTKSFGENQIIAGGPAKNIGIREENYRYTPNYTPFFDTDVVP